ncbi:protein LURP-one-related 15-like [Dendrobium catenatum]|uniref:protein LURP-one-related 15-like n=1 Tax=Dendrobium catenatum TaxID=906689 RepID=UPI00109EFC4C|nr:protein LURP-one-related 15-like [Dendrobium catenatum]XP_028555758.1 protein LURP-one-related 15-like [Dendrobium catenatum]
MGTGTSLKKMAHPVVLIFQKWYLATVDAAGNTIFKTKHYWLGGFTQLQDAAGYTELTMKPKFITWHGRWQAFMGDSMKAKDLVFSIMRSSFLQFYDEWFVYLGGKTEENTYDFRVTGSYRKKNYTIYKGDSSSVVAQMDCRRTLEVKSLRSYYEIPKRR